MFDPYHKWLGIPEKLRPPTHYQLLGIGDEEDDRDVIQAAAMRQIAYVRNFQTGPHGDDATRLLNEIATACTCLVDPVKRAAYNATLRPAAAAQPPPGNTIPGFAVPGAAAPAPPPAWPQLAAEAAPVDMAPHGDEPPHAAGDMGLQPINLRPVSWPLADPLHARPGGGAPFGNSPAPMSRSPAPLSRPEVAAGSPAANAALDPLAFATASAPPLRRRSQTSAPPRRLMAATLFVCGAVLGLGIVVAGLRMLLNEEESPPVAYKGTPEKRAPLAAKPPAIARPSARKTGAAPAVRLAPSPPPGNLVQPAANEPAVVGPSAAGPKVAGSSAAGAAGAASSDLPPAMTGPTSPAPLAAKFGQPIGGAPAADANSPPASGGNAVGAGNSNPPGGPAAMIPANRVGPYDPRLTLNEDRGMSEIRRLDFGRTYCTAMAFSHTGKQLAAGTSDGRIFLWSLDDPQDYKPLESYQYVNTVSITCLAFTPHDDTLLVANNTGWIQAVSMTRQGHPRTVHFPEHHKSVRQIVCLRNGSVGSSGDDLTVRFWNLADGRQSSFFGGFTQSVNCLWVAEDGSRFIASDSLRVGIAAPDNAAGKPLRNYKITPAVTGRAAISHDGHYLLCPEGKGLNVRDLTRTRLAAPFPDDPTRLMGEAHFSRDDQLVATSNQSDPTITLWDFENRTKLASLLAHSAQLEDVAFAPDNRLMASSSLDGTLGIWRLLDLPTMREKATAEAKADGGE